jgi:hypothetical protein
MIQYCFLITYLLLDTISFARSSICLSEMSYYFDLPQSTCPLNNGNRQADILVTYASPDDFRMLSSTDVKLQILAACMQDSPILLKASAFNLPSANTSAFNIGLEIERKI